MDCHDSEWARDDVICVLGTQTVVDTLVGGQRFDDNEITNSHPEGWASIVKVLSSS